MSRTLVFECEEVRGPPDFSVERYHDPLVALDTVIRTQGTFVAHSTRHLIAATR
jgi:hypothetical protein